LLKLKLFKINLLMFWHEKWIAKVVYLMSHIQSF
jgi:hypothetical protein